MTKIFFAIQIHNLLFQVHTEFVTHGPRKTPSWFYNWFDEWKKSRTERKDETNNTKNHVVCHTKKQEKIS